MGTAGADTAPSPTQVALEKSAMSSSIMSNATYVSLLIEWQTRHHDYIRRAGESRWSIGQEMWGSAVVRS